MKKIKLTELVELQTSDEAVRAKDGSAVESRPLGPSFPVELLPQDKVSDWNYKDRLKHAYDQLVKDHEFPDRANAFTLDMYPLNVPVDNAFIAIVQPYLLLEEEAGGNK